jgi:integrase
MGVKIRKRRGKWYVFVNYHGHRKAKSVGNSRQIAEQVKRQLEARLALGDVGFLSNGEKRVPRFDEYAQGWLKRYAELECKSSTVRSYEQLLRVHVTPRFGQKKLTEIRRDEIKQFLSELSQATRVVNGVAVPKFSKNTLRLIVCALRNVLNAAVEDGLIESNPASKVGKFAKSEKPARQASAMARDDAERFLAAIREVCAGWYVFFLTALRAGLRKGELIALKWGDIQFGDSADDPNRYILVQRNYSQGRFTSPKSKKSRRVDLSKQLRAALTELRDTHLLNAMMAGNTSIAEGLVFPSRGGTVIKPDNIVPRYMEPALEQAGLRRFRFHDLRHTFGSLLIQDGASLAYVKEQMGHSTIQITVDTYGHLIPGADIAWVDRLDSKTTQQQNATHAQQDENQAKQETAQVAENIWLPPRDSNPDMLIQSQLSCR